MLAVQLHATHCQLCQPKCLLHRSWSLHSVKWSVSARLLANPCWNGCAMTGFWHLESDSRNQGSCRRLAVCLPRKDWVRNSISFGHEQLRLKLGNSQRFLLDRTFFKASTDSKVIFLKSHCNTAIQLRGSWLKSCCFFMHSKHCKD